MIGGTRTESANGVAVDGSGNIYVVGQTASTDLFSSPILTIRAAQMTLSYSSLPREAVHSITPPTWAAAISILRPEWLSLAPMRT